MAGQPLLGGVVVWAPGQPLTLSEQGSTVSDEGGFVGSWDEVQGEPLVQMQLPKAGGLRGGDVASCIAFRSQWRCHIEADASRPTEVVPGQPKEAQRCVDSTTCVGRASSSHSP